MRKTLIGTGDRSARIRTYNFPQNRVTDHRIELSVYKLDAIMAGAVDDLVDPLREHDKKQRLGGTGSEAPMPTRGNGWACPQLPLNPPPRSGNLTLSRPRSPAPDHGRPMAVPHERRHAPPPGRSRPC